MTLFKDDNSLFNQIVQETYDLLPSGTDEQTGVLNTQLIDYFESNCIKYFRSNYIKNLSCFRIEVENKTLDFPKNWSLFNEVFSILGSSNNKMFHVNEINDNEHIRDIINQIFQQEQDLLFVVVKGQFFLALVPKDETKSLSWIENYLSSNSETSFSA